MDGTVALRRASLSLGLLQILFIICYFVRINYSNEIDAKKSAQKKTVDNSSTVPTENNFDLQYPMFQDTHVMVFIGFGFLMTFLKRYGFSALGFTFLVCALVIQWEIICRGIAEMITETDSDYWIYVSLDSLINADIIAAAVMISFGAVLGKTSPLQLISMAIVETALLVINEYINVYLLKAVDAGGSMFIHAFGAYFGLAVSFVLGHRIFPELEDNKMEGSIYQSDINSMIGTLFLWLFWPSFNAGLLSADQKYRAVIHTYLSLAASCVTTFIISSVTRKSFKYEMVHIQNATLAGGVCVGTSANMMITPGGALIIGSFAGILSTIGFAYIQGFILKKLRIHDTCGVNNLHGMPGIAAGLIGAIMAACSTENNYGDNLTEVFPAMENRSAISQASFQLLALVVTLAISIIGGAITGCIVWKCCANVPPLGYYKDDYWWEMEKGDAET